MSGIFFGGTPAKVLDAWRSGLFNLIVSPVIKKEYARVAEELAFEYGVIDIGRILQLIVLTAETVHPHFPISTVTPATASSSPVR